MLLEPVLPPDAVRPTQSLGGPGITKLSFDSVVRVRSGSANSIAEVRSVEDAAGVLIDWPHARRGPLYHSAREIVEAAMKGQAGASEAEAAFTALASEAGVLVD